MYINIYIYIINLMNEIVNEAVCLICQDNNSVTSMPGCNHTFCK